MEIQELKETLANLVLNDLEILGIDLDQIDADDTVQLYATSDEYCEDFNEATWIASVNNEDTFQKNSFVIITQGTLYDERAFAETGKEVEVGRVMVDINKAEMIVDAIHHAFPEIIYNQISASIEEDENDEVGEKKVELSTEQTLNTEIGHLRRKLISLENQRRKLKEKAAAVDSDECINTYQKVKEFAGQLKEENVEPEVIKRKNTLVFVAPLKQHKIIKITEANIDNIVRENLQDISPKQVTKSILIDKKLARTLVTALNKTFKS